MGRMIFQSPDLPEPIAVEVLLGGNSAHKGREQTLRVTVHPVDDASQPILLEGALTLIGPGEGWLERHGRITPFYAIRRQNNLHVWLNGQTYTFTMASPQKPGSRGGKATAPAERFITAPMPGSVLKVLVQPGDTVVPDQPLVIMESMKMELTLSASHAAIVRRIGHAEGDRVEMGVSLIELEFEIEPTPTEEGSA